MPTVTSPASTGPLRSLELMMQEALESVTSLRCEVAELKTLAATLREEVHGSLVEVSSRSEQIVPSTARAAEADFDWESWTRETRARIRGESLGEDQSSGAS
ncbi:MAG TPA: hypothetical protein VFD39_00155 [Trueperaceae bacterium]|nr:hypothetical protein [Trueperaceae bacterium]